MAIGILSIVLGIVLFIIGIVADLEDWHISKTIIGWFAAGFVCLGIIRIFNRDITPMDVYQGKTTLQYIIVDGVKVDSTVVWKVKEK